jgi:hypothetical protein
VGEEMQSAGETSEECWASTELAAHGVLVRGALQSPLRIFQRLQLLWTAARMEICGCVVALPRKTY